MNKRASDKEICLINSTQHGTLSVCYRRCHRSGWEGNYFNKGDTLSFTCGSIRSKAAICEMGTSPTAHLGHIHRLCIQQTQHRKARKSVCLQAATISLHPRLPAKFIFYAKLWNYLLGQIRDKLDLLVISGDNEWYGFLCLEIRLILYESLKHGVYAV